MVEVSLLQIAGGQIHAHSQIHILGFCTDQSSLAHAESAHGIDSVTDEVLDTIDFHQTHIGLQALQLQIDLGAEDQGIPPQHAAVGHVCNGMCHVLESSLTGAPVTALQLLGLGSGEQALHTQLLVAEEDQIIFLLGASLSGSGSSGQIQRSAVGISLSQGAHKKKKNIVRIQRLQPEPLEALEEIIAQPTLQVPYELFREHLYSATDLYRGYRMDKPETFKDSYDQQVYKYYINKGKTTTDIKETLGRTLHDHSMTNAMNDFLSHFDEKQVVGIMGGHGLLRTEDSYRQVVLVSKKLTESGCLMVSGGGPGAMEATHLGW